MREGSRIQAKTVDAGVNPAQHRPLSFQRIVRPGRNDIHAVLEQIVLDRARRRGGEIDVPGPVNPVDFRRPDQFAQRTLVGFVPDVHRRCCRESRNRSGAAHFDAIIGRDRGRKIVVAVGVFADEGIGALLNQRLQCFHGGFR